MTEKTQFKNEGIYKNRHRARELALQTLYACEVGTTGDWQNTLERIAEDSALSTEVKKYARDLVCAAFNGLQQIDSIIQERAANWDLKRMAAIDRNILRLAVTELKNYPQVPAKVVIDEAVELAKTYGTDDSGKFVNGIIDSIHKKMKKQSETSGKEGSSNGTNPLAV
jgi:N utilization substance protein B